MIELVNSSLTFGEVLIFIVAYIMALCIAMSFHEFAHAYIAKTQGDYTAKIMGRCTLAPHAHVDIRGLICLMLFRFGWAKPVPIDSRNFKNGKKSKFLVSIAGIVMNLLLGTIFLFIYVLIYKISPTFYDDSFYGTLLYYFLNMSFSLNFCLAFFNLLPIYPLDGFRIIETFTGSNSSFVDFMRRYSFIIYIAFIVTGIYQYYYNYTVYQLLTILLKLFSKILGV